MKLDAPCGLTEEYQGDDIVPESEIHRLQLEWKKDNGNYAITPEPSPKFEPGMLVKFTIESGCNLLGDFAEVVSSRYASGDDWSGWVYQLTSEQLTEPIEIGEPWLELISPTTKAVATQRLAQTDRR